MALPPDIFGRPRAPSPLPLVTPLDPLPLTAPHAGPRGRRIDWPAATAADPEKERWTPIATFVATFSDAGLRSLPSTSRFRQRVILNTTNHFWNRKLHRGSLSRTVVAFFDMASDSKCEKSFFGSKIAPRATLLDQNVIKKRPSRHILVSKISQTHHPNTFWMLLLAQSWSRGVSAPSFGASERPPGPPKTLLFLKETTSFPLWAPHRF